MIDEKLTFQKFGYYSSSWTNNSSKLVVASCINCNKLREVQKRFANLKCKSCTFQGRTFTKECLEKMKLARLGKKHSSEELAKMILHHKGFSGRKHTEETKKKMSLSSAWKGKRGAETSAWKGGIAPLHHLIYSSQEYKNWRRIIFESDSYTCQNCNQKGGYLEVHHCNKRFKIIFREFLQQYSQFDPIKDKEILLKLASKYSPFWEISNGKTLCEKCHNASHLLNGKFV